MSQPYQPQQQPQRDQPPYVQPPSHQLSPYTQPGMQPTPVVYTQGPPVQTAKNTAIAAVASLLFPGAGSLYVGNLLIGLGWIGVLVVTWLIGWMALAAGIPIIFGMPLVYIGAAISAYLEADAFNKRHHVVR